MSPLQVGLRAREHTQPAPPKAPQPRGGGDPGSIPGPQIEFESQSAQVGGIPAACAVCGGSIITAQDDWMWSVPRGQTQCASLSESPPPPPPPSSSSSSSPSSSWNHHPWAKIFVGQHRLHPVDTLNSVGAKVASRAQLRPS
eukprot:1233716-Rhodomonas_salina.2